MKKTQVQTHYNVLPLSFDNLSIHSDIKVTTQFVRLNGNFSMLNVITYKSETTHAAMSHISYDVSSKR